MWARIATIAIGVAMMTLPGVGQYGGRAADIHYIVGPLLASVGIIAIGESVRAVRWAGVPLGVVAIAAPVLASMPMFARLASVALGAAAALLATVRGRRDERLGGGWRAIVSDRFDGGAA